jgi:hypothetical protein
VAFVIAFLLDDVALFSSENKFFSMIRWRDGREIGEDRPLFRPIREEVIVLYAVAD